jgi:NAD(P)-dependent dehydrogenase (short-subunit alcohol dehydrogenase family)
MKRLENKSAIITGGATGTGEAISKLFAAEGAGVVVCGYPEDPVTEVVNEIVTEGGLAIAFIGDISIEENARACIAKAVQHFGKLDILINNAGVFPEINETQDFSSESFDYLLKNNIRSAYMMTKHAIPELRKSMGNIVSAGSESGKLGLAQSTAYGGTKGFIHAFTRGVAVEQAQYGIRANCVCPGAIDTAWTHKSTGPMTREMVTMIKSATPMGRRGTPEEIAYAYLFLASDEASYITGELFSVDGGITISKGPIGMKVPKSLKKEPVSKLKLKHQFEGAVDMERG